MSDVIDRVAAVDPTKSPDATFQYVDVSSVSNESFQIEETQTLLGRDAPSRARREIRTGDVLFATIRPTLKRIAMVPNHLDGQVCSTGFFVFRSKPSVLSKYLYYYLFTDQFQKAMESLQTGASYPAVTDAQVRSQSISFPPLAEQRRIVAILDEAFEAIATATANAEKNLANAREFFSFQLGLEFAGFAERYGETSLEEISETISDGDHQPPPKAPGGIPFITISNVDKDTHQIDFSDTFKVPVSYYSALKPNRKPLKGDVLYTVTGSFGIPVLVDTDAKFCFQRHIALVRPASSVSGEWMYYLLLSPQVFEQANAKATGTAQKTVSLATLRGIRVPRVPMETQHKVADRLTSLRNEVAKLSSVYQQKLQLLAELKQTILTEAFSGDLTSRPNTALEAAAE